MSIIESVDCSSPDEIENFSLLLGLDPRSVSAVARNLYGSQARQAVALCGLQAKMDGRVYDGHFWFQVFNLLSSDES